jgi:hypothetical protein
VESIVQQLQKELVRRQKDLRRLPPESRVENPNSFKAQSDAKAQGLDRLSFAGFAARLLVSANEKPWWRLRTYFLTKAENCNDLLTDTRARYQ